MKDINLPLRQAYYARLHNAISYDGEVIPIYYQFVPGDYPKYYMLFQGITSNGRETKTSQDVETGIQLLICTRDDYNGGTACDYIAGKALELVYPERGVPIYGIEQRLVSDNVIPDYDPQTKKQIIERVIIFNHIIIQ